MFNTNTSNTSSNVYGLSQKTRALAHVAGETDINRFLVGTLSLREDNEIALLESKENEGGVKCISIFSHPKEIWSITSCPFDANLFFTVYNTGTSNDFKSSLWRINENMDSIQEVFELKGHTSMIKPILCDPSGSNDYIVSLDDSNIRLWGKIEDSEPQCVKTFGNLSKLSVGSINPNIPNQLATANDVNIKGWDFRNAKETFSIDKAHSEQIRDIDFNPNKPYNLLSAGDDSKLKIWDTRQTKEPVKIFSSHNHWIWSAKFNKFQDQLIITSSSDNTVKLWNLYSLSSANNTKDSTTTNSNDQTSDTSSNSSTQSQQPTKPKKNKRNEDQLIKTYEEHEDSIYNISWGSSNFLFASLSYDGRFVINNVPKEYSDILSYI
ncbi:hypothetical protein DICPUDRAFT_153463 [Dictyostelium purpureum]|uniref:EIPR1-like beta-propeller domain-containing protein n=1 Tax=Dictyostelium purpureum TaxID=5786 RepID=F0ZNZ5_DICPU|nr:uncharacterized protein DICPUDRAFT_153463 [Dictyostelium purpureum]EGC34350.1 hypothetical protein DICPUDRAFT_153463 [Dictyostelium purpureum]|eukprot:XP_003289143.1 hypothetical protein DICPUDRAFT_153463 [Dictyostelium purpureum]